MSALPSPRILIPLLSDAPDFSSLDAPHLWAEIQSVAVARNVAPVVAHVVRPHASTEQRAWCDRILVESWTRHDACLRHLDYALGLLATAQVPVLPLKGPVVGRRHYSPAFLRKPSNDIDLAVRDEHLEGAAAALAQGGYVPEATVKQVRRTSHHLVLNCKGRPSVELHSRLSHGARGVPVDSFFAGAESHVLPTGRSILIPSGPDELFGLVLHFAHDRFASFFHLYELRHIWRASTLETRVEVLNRAVQCRFVAALYLTEIAFQTWWGDRFLPVDFELPRTWLQSRLNETLLHALEENVGTRDRNLGLRLKGRWLDLQVTDSPGEAIEALGLILRVAFYEIVRGRWGTVHLHRPAPVGLEKN